MILLVLPEEENRSSGRGEIRLQMRERERLNYELKSQYFLHFS